MVRNPYEDDLGNRDPLEAMSETPGRIRAVVSTLSPEDLERSHAPGKWTLRQLLVHLAQTELALPVRARMALTQKGYVAQPFDQNDWMAAESRVDGTTALAAYTAVRQMNLQFFSALSASERATGFHHPEYGEITIDWLMRQIAGHELHHLRHFEAVAGQR
ncbi:MAG TPA: DinB family protein [Vicinamibacterales bacterium]|nr:DinB family protein [Acidobacteriota bacterium]HOC17610.1 DinB family protein [Vicinamibacterales bacterium]